ncbi:MAG: hypothetical protein AAFX62_14070 [Pseudomonadota bacterium]
MRAAIGINHAAGVAAALDALEAADPRWGPFVAEGRALLTAYDFGGLGQFAGAGEVAT